MLRIGLTGGMGSGKSTIATIFSVLGIPVYYADQAAKRLMNSDLELKKQIQHHFGDPVYAGGRLDSSYLAAQVFNNREKLELLNSLVHPLAIRDSEKWMELQVTAYAIKEAALIFESGAEKWLDYVIGVFAPISLRLTRIIKRDGISEHDALNRMKNQLDEDTKMNLCNFVIYNNEELPVLPQVLELHEKLLLLANK